MFRWGRPDNLFNLEWTDSAILSVEAFALEWWFQILRNFRFARYGRFVTENRRNSRLPLIINK
jgi:hypothetical protein